MEDVLIVEGVRTAVGGFGGTLKDIPAVELGAKVIAELLKRTGVPAEQIDEVIMGNVLQEHSCRHYGWECVCVQVPPRAEFQPLVVSLSPVVFGQIP